MAVSRGLRPPGPPACKVLFSGDGFIDNSVVASGDNCVLASGDNCVLASARKGEAVHRATTPRQRSQAMSQTAPKTLQKKDALHDQLLRTMPEESSTAIDTNYHHLGKPYGLTLYNCRATTWRCHVKLRWHPIPPQKSLEEKAQ